MAYVRVEQRQEEIVAAAVRVLTSVGVPRTTLRAVAAEADIPLGTLHYVFPTKDRMLRAVIMAVIDDVLATVQPDLEPDRGVAHALRHGVTTFWNTLVERAIGLQIMQYELAMYSVRSEGSGGLAKLQYDRYTALVSSLLEQAARAAGERCAVDFPTLGRLTMAALDGLIVQYLASTDGARARADLDRAVEMLVMFADPRPVGGEG
ncbi:TetR/AcrR family transcriptional regulator [Mycobacterium sp. ML4]